MSASKRVASRAEGDRRDVEGGKGFLTSQVRKIPFTSRLVLVPGHGEAGVVGADDAQVAGVGAAAIGVQASPAGRIQVGTIELHAGERQTAHNVRTGIRRRFDDGLDACFEDILLVTVLDQPLVVSLMSSR